MFQDIRYALRGFGRAPGFALTAMAVLALGIGANTAIFSVVNAVLIRPLPYEHAERLVTIWETRRGGNPMHVSGPNFRDWREQTTTMAGMAAFGSGPMDVSGAMEPDRVETAWVSRGYFAVMGMKPLLGRGFVAEEEKLGGRPAAVISERLWRRSLGADRHVLGRALRALGREWTVVGVAPEAFDYPRMAEIWLPGELEEDTTGRTAHNYRAIGRLKEGVTLRQAQAEMDAISARLEREYPQDDRDLKARLIPLRQQEAAPIRPTLLLLWAAAGFTLLIACVNIANLLLTRTAGRRKEMSVRLALGAGMGRLLRQLLTESVLLALCGGAAGLGLAVWICVVLERAAPEGVLPVEGVGVDGTVLWFALAASVVTGIVFGMAPAWFAGRTDMNEGLKATSRALAGGGGTGLRGALIAGEVALSFVLLAGAGLTAKSLLRLSSVDPGFNPRNARVVGMTMGEQSSDWREAPAASAERIRRYGELLDRVRRLPGVEGAALTTTVPLTGFGPNGGFEIEGSAKGSKLDTDYLDYTLVSEDFVRTMGMRVTRGRSLEESDRRDPDVVLVNEAAARRFWPAGNAMGARIRFYGFEEKPRWLRIVGIVNDIRSGSLAEAPAMAAYIPYFQNPLPLWDYSMVVRTRQGAAMDATLVRAVRGLNPSSPVRIQSMEEIASTTMSAPRLRAAVIAGFAGFAVLLAAVGLYGVIRNAAAQRVREIGIRMALGAGRGDVLKMLLRQAAAMTGVGLAAGAAGALALTYGMRSFLFEVSSADPEVYVGLAAALALTALGAAAGPAWRAARVEPVTVLRDE